MPRKRLPKLVQGGVTATVLEGFIDRAVRAVESGSYDAREDSHLSWLAMVLDEKGWDRLTALLASMLDRGPGDRGGGRGANGSFRRGGVLGDLCRGGLRVGEGVVTPDVGAVRLVLAAVTRTRPSELLVSLDRGAVGADLGPGGAQLGGVEAEGEDRVGALGFGLLDQPLLVACSRPSESIFVIPFSSPPARDFSEAPIWEPRLRERTVSPKTSPSTSWIS